MPFMETISAVIPLLGLVNIFLFTVHVVYGRFSATVYNAIINYSV